MSKKTDKEIWESTFKDEDLVEAFDVLPGPKLPPRSKEEVLIENYNKEQLKLKKEVKELQEKVEKLLKYVKLNVRGLDSKIKQGQINFESLENGRNENTTG